MFLQKAYLIINRRYKPFMKFTNKKKKIKQIKRRIKDKCCNGMYSNA
jgi:hypothetical protein